ncbi:hypothetical protein AWB79_06734 [Caballeronia hypogeia]|uniref:Uncharacterized protein n=1 Tax=Caballeronia hypogeia TaxID=1777140 RepID=A0A158DBX4_9BURK|nr:hypothetical protein AWB79_06734 [Caballeronia hypogeia]
MIDQAASSWPYIVGFGVVMRALGRALKWIHSIKSGRAVADARRA